MSVSLTTPQEVCHDLAHRFKARRLLLNLSQEGLAARSGVSWSSLKRFERTGLIALDSLLKLALVLDCLEDFEKLCVRDETGLSTKSLDQLLAKPRLRRKGSLK